LLEPYSGNTGKRITKSPKIYLRDTGLLNYLEGISDYQSLLSHPNAGAIWEGFVIEQIRSILPANIDICFYRTQHGAEVDLIITKPNDVKIGVEIKFSSSPTLSKGNYEVIKDLDLERLYVIIPTNDQFLLKKNIEVIGLQSFLEKVISTIEI
jgi:predicted AAA+ superfamily ATPase